MARVKREAGPYLRRLRGHDGTSSYAGELKGGPVKLSDWHSFGTDVSLDNGCSPYNV